MKKPVLLPLLMALALFLLPVSALADALPLPAQPSPLSYSVEEVGGNDILYVWYAVPEDVRALYPAAEEKTDPLLPYSGELVSFGLQIDFSPDGSRWLADAGWDAAWNVGAYNDLPRSLALRGEEILSLKLYDLSDDHIFSALSEAAPGLVKEAEDGRRFDFEKGALFLRCRYFAALKQDGQTDVSHSGWSETLDVGRTSSVGMPERMDPPALSDLAVTGGSEDDSVLTFVLHSSESARQAGAHYAFMGDGSLDELAAEYRVNAGDWLPAAVADADQPLTEGDRRTDPVEAIPADAFVEFRVCYGYTGPEGYVTTDWSEPISCGTVPPSPTEAPAMVCTLCGDCSAPLGVCLWVWIGGGGLLLLIGVVLAVVFRKQRCPSCGERCSRKAEHCPNCHLRLRAPEASSEDGQAEAPEPPSETSEKSSRP